MPPAFWSSAPSLAGRSAPDQAKVSPWIQGRVFLKRFQRGGAASAACMRASCAPLETFCTKKRAGHPKPISPLHGDLKDADFYIGNTAQIDARILLAYYSVILTKFSLTCVSKPASNLANLTKNLTAQSAHALCAV